YSAKADPINNIITTKAYLPEGGSNNIYGSTDTSTGWQPVDDGKTVGAGGRDFAYIIGIENQAFNSIQYQKSTESEETWTDLGESFSYGTYHYYVVSVNAGDAYSLKFKYKETETSEEVTTDVISAFTWTQTTNEISATITRGENVTNIANDGQYYLKKNDVLTVTIKSTSAPGTLTAFNVFGENVELTQYSTVTPDPQTLIYTYTYTKTFDSDTNTEMTTAGAITATINESPLSITNCNYAYDATTPTISAKFSDGTAYNIDYDETNTDKWYGSLVDPINSVQFTASSGGDEHETDLSAVTVDEIGQVIGNVKSFTFTRDLDEGTNNGIAVSVSDLSGNTSGNITYTFKIDNTAPKVDTLKVGGYSDNDKFVGLTNNNVAIEGTTSDLCANSAQGSGVEKVTINIYNSDNDLAWNKEIDVPEGGTYSINLTDFNDVNPEALANGTYDGSYRVSVTATDRVGHVSTAKELTFTLDTKKPSITYTLERHAAGAADDEWEVVPAADVDAASNTYFVNNVTYDKLRYKIEITETNLLAPVVCKNADTGATLGNFEVDTTDPSIYYYVIQSNDLTTAEPLALKAVVTDEADNVNSDDNQILLPKLQLVDSDIKVELLEVWCDGEKLADATSLANLTSDFNKVYTIKVRAKSGFKMTNMELRIGDDTYSAIPSGSIGDIIDTTGIHTTNNNEFALPVVTENKKFDDLNLYVKNSNGDFKVVSIGDLLYDNTEPLVINKDAEVDYNKWYQEYTFNYEIKSGESAVESNLKSAQYSVDGEENALTPSGTSQTGSIDVPESKTVAGTKIVFAAEDKATNNMPGAGGVFNIKIDKTNPTVAALKINGEEVTESVVLAGSPSISTTVTDNLTIDNYAIVIKYNNEDEVYSFVPVVLDNKEVTEENVSYELDKILGSKELKDGTYTIDISARDMSRRQSNNSTTSFIVDNTKPVLGSTILSGTSGKNNGYYNTDVEVRLTCFDNNFDLGAMQVTDNGTPITADWKVGNDMFYADVKISSEGLHNIMVEGKDKAGNQGEAKQISFIIDKTAPTVALLVNGGQIYNESRGTLNLTGPLTLTASVSDTNEDATDLRVQVIKTVPDTATTTSEFMPTGERTFTFADEADYVINIYAVDKANNQGTTRTISFRVDTNAPQINITGANGETVANATSVSFNIVEAFWSDAKGTVEIYRKAGDGFEETLYKTLTITPTQRTYSLSELLSESGVYRFEFTADDLVGHTATTSQTITIDRNKPEITLTGVNNYDSTDGAVTLSAVIRDEFYTNKQVSITGTRTDAEGKKTAITFSPFAAGANPTTINDTFTEDGIYDITISATDIAGNVSSNSVHFTIDTSDPVIGDLSMYDKKTFNAKTFEDLGLDIDLDELVSDLTVCNVRMYLNGSEYDGISEIEDGSYTLLITAEDELGHTSEKSATFVLDTKAPIFIVTGVEDGEIKNDNYNIEVSLQLDEDTLDEVTLNGTNVTVKNNVATIDVTSKGEYELYMKAHDEAGNEEEDTISFVYGEESVATVVTNAVEKAASHWWLWAVVAAAILAAGGGIFFVLKRRKED
ncbi:MAG: hypothetical protein IJ167_07975, partial [Lachnospiraceae bacterium]|nr:hypothetical protein [Lachnospiraceae bacterium]